MARSGLSRDRRTMLWKDMARPSPLTALTQQDNLGNPQGAPPTVLPSYRLRASPARPLVKDAAAAARTGLIFSIRARRPEAHVRLAASAVSQRGFENWSTWPPCCGEEVVRLGKDRYVE